MIWAAVGGLGGVAGAIAAVVALVYAHKANTKADTSNAIATDSKDLAVEANKLSRESNTIATAARDLAEEANNYSHRAEARETEQHDVRWDDDWLVPSHGIYAVTKRGRDSAHNVRITVVYDGQEQTQSVGLVEAEGAEIEFEFPSAARAYAAELREYQAHLDAVRRHHEEGSGPFGVGLSPAVTSPFTPDYHSVEVRVAWVTALGTPKIQEEEHRLMTFGFS